jgi:hypothetical protein
MRRRAALLGLASFAWPVMARAQERPLPSPPADAPPAPPSAANPRSPVPPARPVTPRLALTPSLSELAGGGWRLRFPPRVIAPDAAARTTLAEIGRRLAAGSTGRVTLIAQASTGEDVSTSRRIALDRGVAVRAALVAGGLPETRVDVLPRGRTPTGLDTVDILPPGAARPD